MRLEEKLNCLGYWGFGSGYAMAKMITAPGEAIYCTMCPIRQECWDRHKARVAGIFPALVEEFERMAKEVQGPELLKRWFEMVNNADPYTVVLGGNIEDGMAVGLGQPPKDRGPGTLAWPLKPYEKVEPKKD